MGMAGIWRARSGSVSIQPQGEIPRREGQPRLCVWATFKLGIGGRQCLRPDGPELQQLHGTAILDYQYVGFFAHGAEVLSAGSPWGGV